MVEPTRKNSLSILDSEMNPKYAFPDSEKKVMEVYHLSPIHGTFFPQNSYMSGKDNSLEKGIPVLNSYFTKRKEKWPIYISQMPNFSGILICIVLVTNKMPLYTR